MDHPEIYTVGESARRAVLLVRTSYRFVRGKSTAKVDQQLEKLAADAIEREAKAKRGH